MTLSTSQKLNIQLAPAPFAAGAEGELFLITSPSQFKNHVAKIYFPHKREDIRHKKFQYLINNKPNVSETNSPNAHLSLIWAEEALYENGKFVGFIMPKASGKKLEILCTNKLPAKLDKEWERFDFNNPKSVELRLKVAFNLCIAVHLLHASGRYLLIDLKPDNVMIQPNGLVSLVDLDSVEVVENGITLYDAAVATPEYTPAEKYQKELGYDPTQTEEWDRFSLAVILYKLLLGIHPFSASSLPPYDNLSLLEQKIEYGLFVHNASIRSSFLVIPPLHQRFYQLPTAVQNLFLQALEQGFKNPENRPRAADWAMGIAEHFGIELSLEGLVFYEHKLNLSAYPLFSSRYVLNFVSQLESRKTSYEATLNKNPVYNLQFPVISQQQDKKSPHVPLLDFKKEGNLFQTILVSIIAIIFLVGISFIAIVGGIFMSLFLAALYLVMKYGQYKAHYLTLEKFEQQKKVIYNKADLDEKQRNLNNAKLQFQSQQNILTTQNNSGILEDVKKHVQKTSDILEEAKKFEVWVKQQDQVFIDFFNRETANLYQDEAFLSELKAQADLQPFLGETTKKTWENIISEERQALHPLVQKLRKLEEQIETLKKQLVVVQKDNKTWLEDNLQIARLQVSLKIIQPFLKSNFAYFEDIKYGIFGSDENSSNVQELLAELKQRGLDSPWRLLEKYKNGSFKIINNIRLEFKHEDGTSFFLPKNIDTKTRFIYDQFIQFFNEFKQGDFKEKQKIKQQNWKQELETLQVKIAKQKELDGYYNSDDFKTKQAQVQQEIERLSQEQQSELTNNINSIKQHFKNFKNQFLDISQKYQLQNKAIAQKLQHQYNASNQLCEAQYNGLIKQYNYLNDYSLLNVEAFLKRQQSELNMLLTVARRAEILSHEIEELNKKQEEAEIKNLAYANISFGRFLLK